MSRPPPGRKEQYDALWQQLQRLDPQWIDTRATQEQRGLLSCSLIHGIGPGEDRTRYNMLTKSGNLQREKYCGECKKRLRRVTNKLSPFSRQPIRELVENYSDEDIHILERIRDRIKSLPVDAPPPVIVKRQEGSRTPEGTELPPYVRVITDQNGRKVIELWEEEDQDQEQEDRMDQEDQEEDTSAVHLGDRPHQCTYQGCHFATARLATLKKHINAVHEGEKKYKCTYQGCNHTTACLRSLKRHIDAVHEGKKPHKCTYPGCNYASARNDNLKNHISTMHQGEKKYKCTYQGCKFGSNLAGHIKRHIVAVHQGEKPYKCTYPDCYYTTARNDSLRRHIFARHQGEKPYKCTYPGCDFTTAWPESLRYHISEKHKKRKESFQDVVECIEDVFRKYSLGYHDRKSIMEEMKDTLEEYG